MAITPNQTIRADDFDGIKMFKGYAADAGSTDDYAITVAPAPSAYATGDTYIFKANTANTGAATLNVNSLGAKTIKKVSTNDLETGDITAGQFVTVVYDGTNFQMINVGVKKFSSGAASKNLADASGTQTIAHGLTVPPKIVKIAASYTTDLSAQPQALLCRTSSVYSGGTQSSESTVIAAGDGSTGSNGYHDQNFRVWTLRSSGGDAYQTGVITVDATNIYIAWTKYQSPCGTAYLVWEAAV